ncbi:MAG: T9SS type A sorting domain-containing protein [Bacteroidetes bacterium]|nr:T9SS type A sorting domain-containing protein [Bacteroidota bacterium]
MTNSYKLNQGSTRFQADLSEFGRGIYLLEVQTGNYSKTLKLVVL